MDFSGGVAVGEDGSIYLTGTSSGNWLGAGGKQPLHSYRAAGDLVVIKLDAQGGYQWHTFYGSSDFDAGTGIAIAGDGSIYVSAQSYGSWLGAAEAQPRQPEGEGNNLVVLKLNSQGAYQWHRFFGSEGLDFAKGVALHGDGSVNLAGYSDSSWLGDGSAGPIHPHSGDYDLVVVKLNSQGAYQ